MKMSQITQNSYQLNRLGFVNCYLVRESDGFTLIDAGIFGNSAAGILDADGNSAARFAASF